METPTGHLITALRYIASRKCDCAKAAKEPPPCSHQVAKDALAEHERIVTTEWTKRHRR